MRQLQPVISREVALEKLKAMSADEYYASNDAICRVLIPLVRKEAAFSRPQGRRGHRSIDPSSDPMVGLAYDLEAIDRRMDEILYLKVVPQSKYELRFQKNQQNGQGSFPQAIMRVTNPVWMSQDELESEMAGDLWDSTRFCGSLQGIRYGHDIIAGGVADHEIKEVELEIWRTPWSEGELPGEARVIIELIRQFSVIQNAYTDYGAARDTVNSTYALLSVMGCDSEVGPKSIFRGADLSALTAPKRGAND